MRQRVAWVALTQATHIYEKTGCHIAHLTGKSLSQIAGKEVKSNRNVAAFTTLQRSQHITERRIHLCHNHTTHHHH